MATKVFRIFLLSLVTVFALAFLGCSEETAETPEGEAAEGAAVEGEGAAEGAAAEGAAAEGAAAEGAAAEGEAAEGEAAEGEAAAAAPATFATPEDVFKAAQAATEGKDYAKLLQCYDPDSKKDMVAGMVVAIGAEVKKNKEKKAAADELLAKYEVPDMKKLKGNKKKKAMKALGESIKDVDGFLVDTMKFLEKEGDKKAANPYAGELLKVKMKGDKAIGKVKGAKGKPKPMKFIKVEDSWYIDI